MFRPRLFHAVAQYRLISPPILHNLAAMGCRQEPRVYTSEPNSEDISVLDYLLKSEKDGEQYYRDLAAQAPNQEFRHIFTLLANEEEKHYKTIEKWQGSTDAAFAQSTCSILGTTQSLFQELRKNPSIDLLSLKDHLALYTEIRNIEAQSRDAYLERARKAQDPSIRALLKRMAHEEQKHFLMLDELVRFIEESEQKHIKGSTQPEKRRSPAQPHDILRY